MFLQGNILRVIVDYAVSEEGTIVEVVENQQEDNNIITCKASDREELVYFNPNEVELVADSLQTMSKKEPSQPPGEQTVAIVSFEGAVKRESLAINNSLATCDTISGFEFRVHVSSNINGDMKIEYTVETQRYGDQVTGVSVHECVAELLRRHGWNQQNKPKSISYRGVNE